MYTTFALLWLRAIARGAVARELTSDGRRHRPCRSGSCPSRRPQATADAARISAQALAPGRGRPRISSFSISRSSPLIAFSFNDSKRNITWQGFTLKYYDQAFHNSGLQEAFLRSIGIALTSTVVSTVIGSLLGLAIYRYRFPLKGPFEGLIYLPIVIPEICMAMAMRATSAR